MKAIRTRYLGPTNTRGSRIVADDDDGNRVVMSYRSDLNVDDNRRRAAELLYQKMNWENASALISAWFGNDCYFMERTA